MERLTRPFQGRSSSPTRIDRWLQGELGSLSRNAIQKLINEGRVQVNGRPVKPSYSLREGDVIDVGVSSPEIRTVVPEPIPIEIVHADGDVIVVNKPAGMVVHPGAGVDSGTLVAALLHRFGSLAASGGPLRPGIVHRLDRGTSGVMVVARSEHAYADLIGQFHDRLIQKEYRALVWGRMEGKGVLEAPIGRHPKIRKVMSVRKSGGGREARTGWESLAVRELFSFLRLIPESGRTHQIRVHLNYAGHPIVGDPTYGIRKVQGYLQKLEAGHPARRLHHPFLHAFRLGFIHPTRREPVRFEVPLPEELSSVLTEIGMDEGVEK